MYTTSDIFPVLPIKHNRPAVSGVGGVQGGRTQTDRLTGVAQDTVLEEVAILVKDRTGLKLEAQIGQCRKKTSDGGDGGIRNITSRKLR